MSSGRALGTASGGARLTKRRRRWLLIVIAIAAAAIRLAVGRGLLRAESALFSDMDVYDRLADRLGGAVVEPWGALFPMGYPALLALLRGLFGRSYVVVSWVQALLGAATAVLTFLIGERLGGSPRVALLGAAIVTLHLPSIFYGSLLLSEVPASFLLTLGVCLLMGTTPRNAPGALRSALSGAILGLACALRPNFLILVLLLGSYLLLRWRPSEKVIVAGIGFLSGLVSIVAFVSWHNSRSLGHFTGLSGNGGINFFLSHSEYRGAVFEGMEVIPIRNAKYYTRFYKSPVPLYDEPFFYREGLRLLTDDPWRLVRAIGNVSDGMGMGPLTYWPADEHALALPRAWQIALRAFGLAFFPLLVMPALLSVSRAAEASPLAGLADADRSLFLPVFLALIATLYLYLGDPRIHVPYVPLIAVASADGWMAIASWARAGRQASTPPRVR